MNYTEFLKKMENLKSQIERENTGTAEELAQKLCFSRRTLFNYFDLLKDKGCNIKFSRYRNTYYFDEMTESNDKN
jgi:predicted DNA-binding transcriptional regulator YafY